MIELLIKPEKSEGLDLLFLGAHCDDIEIGCGGALLKLKERYPINSVVWVVFASTEERKKEAIQCANLFFYNVQITYCHHL